LLIVVDGGVTVQTEKPTVELRIRTLRVIWIGLLSSIGAYFALTLLVERPEGGEPNTTLSLILVALSASTTMASFLVKGKLLGRAIEQEQPAQVQQAYVVAWALTEVAALLGVIDYFTTSNAYYYALFLIAAGGQLLHFPRSEHVINASFKRTNF
jgi:hypothetical protein